MTMPTRDAGPADAAPDDVARVEALGEARTVIEAELAKVIVGQKRVIEEMLIALFSRGHCLFVGVPGLAKTLLVSSLARVLDLSFNRIQFTPDLMPADITGTEVLREDKTTGAREFTFIRGPIFANLLLADEINRTSPKTQAALLQAMQEYTVTAGGVTYDLPRPFLVFATQNPIEQEGTYPLPEAQLDRFMFMIDVEYPDAREEADIVTSTTSAYEPDLHKVLHPEDILGYQDLVRRVPVSESVVKYAVNLVRRTRPGGADTPEVVREYVAWGAGPRASQALILAGKARAILAGRYAVSTDDIRALAKPILQHRILVNFRAEADGVTAARLVGDVIAAVPETA